MRSPIGPGLGECWCSVGHAIQYAERIGERWSLCSIGSTLGRLRGILPLFEGSEKIDIVEGRAKPLKGQVWSGPRTRTKVKWTGSDSIMVTYQFNASLQDETKLLAAMYKIGLMPMSVDPKANLAETISLMARSAMHLCVDSDLAHVGLSVGLPVIVAQDKFRFSRTGSCYEGTDAFLTNGWRGMFKKVCDLIGVNMPDCDIPELLPEYETSVVKGVTFKHRGRDGWILHHGFNYPLPKCELKTVVDIGAHVGSFSARILHLFPSANLYSVEPTPESFYLLSLNAPKANLTMAAIGDPSMGGFKESTISDRNTGGACYSESGSDIKVIDPLEYLQSIIDKHGKIDVLKCDCEGGEWSLFERAGHLFWHIDYAIFEIHIYNMGVYFRTSQAPDLTNPSKMIKYVEDKTGMKCSILTNSRGRNSLYEVALTKR
jgi:FkbM family methyltransferase